jgi:hypothetical protein
MFTVDEMTAAAIRQAYDDRGELSAVVELRQRFTGIVANDNARRCVRAILSWQSMPSPPPKTSRKCRARSSTQ